MKLCMVGAGAFANKHLDALANIAGVEVAALVGGVAEATEQAAEKHNIPKWTLDLEEGLSQSGIKGVILATPTPLHASQAQQVLRSGKHVLVEIPMAGNLADAEPASHVGNEDETGGGTRPPQLEDVADLFSEVDRKPLEDRF